MTLLFIIAINSLTPKEIEQEQEPYNECQNCFQNFKKYQYILVLA